VTARRQLAWRLCREPLADLVGEGARRYGGRWNTRGRPLVYAASCAALAVLEMRVHLDLMPELLPDDYVLVTIELADVTIEEVTELPAEPAVFGDDWLAERRSAVLQVPSVIVPESANLLLNPAHPSAGQARIIRRRPFAFDPRLWLPL
jgi:RES domain-containing protein